MPSLKEKPTLKDYQEYVKKLEVERGFEKQNILDKCLMLGEEVGELYKAVRKTNGLKVDQNSKITELDGEIADVFIFLLSIANRADIDMEKAFREKEEINKKRTWR